jgi:septal ring factor EnvC (AmiA/AmiB activator)
MGNLQDKLSQAEVAYDFAKRRNHEAINNVRKMEAEIASLKADSRTKPNDLVQKLMTLEASRLMLPALAGDVTATYNAMMQARMHIADDEQRQKARQKHAEAMRRQLDAMTLELADKRHQLRMFEDAIDRHASALAALVVDIQAGQ